MCSTKIFYLLKDVELNRIYFWIKLCPVSKNLDKNFLVLINKIIVFLINAYSVVYNGVDSSKEPSPYLNINLPISIVFA